MPAGAQGPGFLMLQNFRSIMKYNPAEAYALAIGHLADRLRGGEPFIQPWPRHERVLSRAERLELQQHLARGGYDVGEPDGRFGPRTRNALRAFQAAVGATAGRVCHRVDSRAPAQPLIQRPREKMAKIPVNSSRLTGNHRRHLPIDIFVVVLADDCGASR